MGTNPVAFHNHWHWLSDSKFSFICLRLRTM